jgi:hypothetical protein
LIVSDEKLQGLKVETARSLPPATFRVLELKDGKYEMSSRPDVHYVVRGLDQRVVQVVLKDWKGANMRRFAEVQRGPIQAALAGTPVRDVRRVIVVLGLSSVVISPGSVVTRQDQRTLTSWVGEDLKEVLLHLLSWFPAADMLYLGAGRVWKRLPEGGAHMGITKVNLDLVNGSGVRLFLGVLEFFQNFPKHWAIFVRREAREGRSHSRPWGKLRAFDLFERMPDECILNVQGDLTPLGFKWFGEALRGALLSEYPGCLQGEHTRSVSSKRRSRSMPRRALGEDRRVEARPLREAAPLIDLWSRRGSALGPTAPGVDRTSESRAEALRRMGFID